MTAPRPDLSIVIPAYMEAERIADVLEELAAYLKTRNYGLVEVVVVTADSPDGTAKIAAQAGQQFPRFRLVHAGPRIGKGRDVRLGMFESIGRYRVFMDADLATPLHHLDRVKELVDQNAQIGIAVRNLFEIHEELGRKVMSSAANLAAQTLIVPGIKDTQCGFKVFEASVAIDLFSRMTMMKWSFDMEILAIAKQRGYHINFIDVSDWHDPKSGATGLAGDSLLKVAASSFLDPFKIRLGLWTGRYAKPSYVHKSVY